MSSIRFKCGTCGQWHEGLPDVGYAKPDYYFGVPEDERSKRIYITSDLCVIDDTDFFVRCLLLIPIRGTEECFGLGVWSTLSKPNFLRYQEHYDEDMSDWEPMFGYLSNQITDYPDTLSLHLNVQPQEKGARPHVTVKPSEHPLSIDQREGIPLERAIEIATSSIHQDD